MKKKQRKSSRGHFERQSQTKAPRRFKGRIAHRPEFKTENKKTPAIPSQTVVGVVVKTKFGWSLEVSNRKDKQSYIIRNPAKAEGAAGELIAAKMLPSTKKGRQEVEIEENLGNPDDPRAISLIAIHAKEIPDVFPDEVLREAEQIKNTPVMPAKAGIPFGSKENGTPACAGVTSSLEKRTDLRLLPLVTIDGPDARDFDDAVFAEKDGEGWHLIVAIADVAHYVRAGSPLDKEAYRRGNSTYFPDRVVPMLPEALSNDLCSLMPQVDRACMAAHLWIDKAGELTRWQFVRGLMKSKARLTYEQVQAARDGKPDETTKPLLKDVIEPLYGAYECLMRARLERGTLELDLPERKVELTKDGDVKAISVRERFDSHKLIEEFMILANVAAAAQLEGKGGICIYRVHDKPNEIKLDALRDFLDTLGISLAPARQLHPRLLTQILEKAAGGEHAQVVNEVMLRSQAQAIYSRENIGHFGLALAKYAHFTSPIRRYADLVVHRGLIRACKLGSDGLTEDEIERLEEISEHISATERRSIEAEREAVDRFVALYLTGKVGAVFGARISGVARFGLFARLDETGADGIIPFKALPNDYYELDEKKQALVGQRSKRIYRLGETIKVRLDTADRLTGSLSFVPVEKESPRPQKGRRR